jgi:FkbM family methyltransferase
MGKIKTFYLKLRSILKKIKFIVTIKKIIFNSNFLYKLIINNKIITFDSHKKKVELLATNNFNEKYIINTSDIEIGRSLYINDNSDFDNFLNIVEIIKNNIKTVTLVDIGANIGNICIPAVKRGIFKNCLAIEPEPYNFDLLTKNIFINDVSNKIQTFNVALAEFDNQKKEFHLCEDNYGDHRIKSNLIKKFVFNEDKRKKTIYVETKRLDTVLKNFNPKETLVWMDVQGYEALVLEGGINTLSKKPPLVIEFFPYLLDTFNSYDLLKKNLVNFRYTNCYDTNTKSYIKGFTGDKLDDLYFYYKSRFGVFTNLLFFD